MAPTVGGRPLGSRPRMQLRDGSVCLNCKHASSKGMSKSLGGLPPASTRSHTGSPHGLMHRDTEVQACVLGVLRALRQWGISRK